MALRRCVCGSFTNCPTGKCSKCATGEREKISFPAQSRWYQDPAGLKKAKDIPTRNRPKKPQHPWLRGRGNPPVPSFPPKITMAPVTVRGPGLPKKKGEFTATKAGKVKARVFHLPAASVSPSTPVPKKRERRSFTPLSGEHHGKHDLEAALDSVRSTSKGDV